MSKLEIVNLTTKNIKDFKEGDTLYVSLPLQPGFKETWLAEIYLGLNNQMVSVMLLEDCSGKKYESLQYKTQQIVNVKLEKCFLYGKDKNDKYNTYHWFNSLGYALDKLDDEKEIENEFQREHPSYGLLSFSKINKSHSSALFGSSVKLNHTITLQLSTASHDRNLANDWYHPEKTLFQIEMTPTQFAELISTFNDGSGTPVTITYNNGERIDYPEFTSRYDTFTNEFNSKLHNIGKDIEKLTRDSKEILEKKTSITKGDRELILNSIQKLKQELTNNVEFVSEMFVEQMDKTVTEAKLEVDNFIRSKQRQHQLDIPQNEILKLGEGNEN